MMADARRQQPASRRFARLLTELLAPAPTAAVLLIVVAMHSAPTAAAALRWAGIAILFGCVLPFLYILRGVRRRQLSDHHIHVRQQRPIPILVGLASVLAGFALLTRLGAPHGLLVVVVAWARVRLGDHTVAQVIGGGCIGAVVAAATVLALR
jgi:hypothetical protein